jgi:glycine cleavage system H protein
MSAEIPDNLMFSKEHEWLQIEGEKAVIGLSDHAQEELGDIVFVELPDVGSDIEQMEELGVVESVKTVSTMYAPVSGEIIAVNEALLDNPELINENPYEEGWIAKIAISDMNEVDDLLTAEEYQELLEDPDEEE